MSEPETASARAWIGSALIVLGALVLIVGLLVLDSDETGWLAAVVGPAVALVAAGAALVP